MALVSDLVGAFDGRQASLIGDTYADAVAATGETQGTAFQLSATFNNVTTTDETNLGVKLPAIKSYKGSIVMVKNNAADTITIYPYTGEKINALEANIGVTLASGSIMVLYKVSTTKWVK